MLDDDHRVAKVAEPFQCREQPVVVALMEADAWFVENIEHPRQAAADLAGETDALAFAAAERAAGAVEVQIIEPDIVEKAEPLVDLLQNRFGDLLLRVVQLFFERGEPIERIRHRAMRRQADRKSTRLNSSH